mmetsp:Transcript_13696/g.22345  ORF Transcript_13696/g.22345 Transcript_13696/m.22345 type:complete len:208 (-) Transcript_13696:68-691(-)
MRRLRATQHQPRRDSDLSSFDDYRSTASSSAGYLSSSSSGEWEFLDSNIKLKTTSKSWNQQRKKKRNSFSFKHLLQRIHITSKQDRRRDLTKIEAVDGYQSDFNSQKQHFVTNDKTIAIRRYASEHISDRKRSLYKTAQLHTMTWEAAKELNGPEEVKLPKLPTPPPLPLKKGKPLPPLPPMSSSKKTRSHVKRNASQVPCQRCETV